MKNENETTAKKTLQWHQDGTFSFLKGKRPLWTTEAKKIELAQGEDRRHGLHGAEIITKASQTFINNELKKSGTKKTHKKLRVNLKSRLLKNFDDKTLDELINAFRRYAFSKISNLLPGDGDYNKAIESVRRVITNLKSKMHKKFFSKGEMPDEVNPNQYKRYCLAQLRTKTKEGKSRIKSIVNDIFRSVIIPRVQTCEEIIQVDDVLVSIIDTTKIDIGFSDTKGFKRYNKRVLTLDTRIKRGIINQEGITQEWFNKLIGYRPRKKK